MRYSLSTIFSVLIFLLFLTSCSGGGNSPVAPGVTDNNALTQGVQDDSRSGNDSDLPATGQDTSGLPDLTDPTDLDSPPSVSLPLQVNHSLWGLYQFIVDPVAETLEIVPLRVANLHLNALKFLEPGGTYNMVQLASPLTFSSGGKVLDLDVRIVHPFAGLNQFSGFDVKAILITKGTKAGFSDPDLVIADVDETRLLNYDGLTRWWNPTDFPGNSVLSYVDGAIGKKDAVADFECTLNGYKLFADALTPNKLVEDMNLADRAIFRAGASNIRHLKLSLLGGLILNYAIDASWAAPSIKPPVNLPDDFPIGANQPEPYRITATEVLNSLYYEGPSSNGGQLWLDLHVYDWQSPLPTTALGTVEQVVGEWGGLFPPVEAEFISNQGDYAVYRLILQPANGALTSTDDVEYLIWAESQDGDGYGGILDPSEKLISVNRFSTSVASEKPNTPPIIQDGVTGETSPGLFATDYTVTAMDLDTGDILTYSWSVEEQGLPYVFDDPGDGAGLLNVNWASLGFGNYTVQCRVSDGVNTPVEATALDVSVGNTPPSLGDIQGLIDVAAEDTSVQYAVNASDPDGGQTLVYTWSFVPSGNPESFTIPGDILDGSMWIDYSAVDPGEYDINVRVTDGFSPVTGTKIDIIHNNTPPNVEAINGALEVDPSNTDEPYESETSDPDTTQTLSFLWSIVPENDPEDFSLPSNPDGSINVDWSAYAIGMWDVNVRVSDGIAAVNGPKITVNRKEQNFPPTVGDVVGPSPVTHATFSADYTATMNDVNGDTLIVLWSVVPFGSPANFIIPGAQGSPLNVNWSAYPAVGGYDVNVRVDDSHNPPVTGIKLTVILANTPPQITACSGLETVNTTNTNENYTVNAADIDTLQSLLSMWSVVPDGNPADYSIGGGMDLSMNFNWSTVPVGAYDIMVQVADGLDASECGPINVTKVNIPPLVGVVSGPTIVNCTNSSTYSAPYSDADADQTLTVMWSVVPTGNSPSYVISAQGNGSLLFNWATVAPGMYDVNIRVGDGFVQVEGTLLKVTKGNSPPVVGNITGSGIVTNEDTEPYSIIPAATDCDTSQTLTYMYSIVPKGNAPNYDKPSVGGNLLVDWSLYTVGIYTMGCRVSDGIAQVYAGTLEVVVTLPPCTGAAHSYLGSLTLGTYSMAAMSVIARADISYMEGGIPGIKGKGLAQIGPSTIGIFDANTSGPSSVLFTYFLQKTDNAVSIDTDPNEGRILVVTSRDPEILKVIDSEIISPNPIVAQFTTGNPNITWVAIDVDETGDFFAITRVATPTVTYASARWAYTTKVGGYYTQVPGSVANITPQVGTESDIFDIAIDQSNDRLYLFEAGANGRGVIHTYNISTGKMVYMSSTINLFPSALDFQPIGTTGNAAYADIDIDHHDPDDERCRLLVYGRLTGQAMLIRLDSQMNVLDTKLFVSALPAFAINSDVNGSGIRNLIMPDVGVIQVFSKPLDW